MQQKLQTDDLIKLIPFSLFHVFKQIIAQSNQGVKKLGTNLHFPILYRPYPTGYMSISDIQTNKHQR